MRILTTIFAMFAMFAAFAFDAAEWQFRKEVLMREAERLQAVYTASVARVKMPAENVCVPVETHPDGSVKTLVTASKAQFFTDNGIVWAKDLQAKDFDTSKKNKSSIFAEKCVVDRETKSGWIEGAAKAVHGSTEVTGERVYVSFAENFVMIYSNAFVRSDDVKKSTNTKGGSAKTKVEVRADKADYDRTEGVVFMDGHVRFDDGEYSLVSDRAWVFLSGTNELRRVVASGSVAVTNGLKRGYCDKVLYERKAGNITMYGRSQKELAHLIDEGPDGGELQGTRIFFRTDAEQVEVDNPIITVKGDVKKADIFSEGRGK